MSSYRLLDTDETYGTAGRARVWTYRTGTVWATDEDEARTLLLAEAHRIIPAVDAEARILSIRRTPTGRWSALMRRERW